jgi:hypothetical protein
MSKKLYLLDALALIYRAYYALIRTPRITSTGINTNAQFGFTNTLLEIIKKENESNTNKLNGLIDSISEDNTGTVSQPLIRKELKKKELLIYFIITHIKSIKYFNITYNIIFFIKICQIKFTDFFFVFR